MGKNNTEMQLFYTPDITNDAYVLSEEESKHCIRVLRKKAGDTLHLTNGKGTIFKAEITNAKPKACELSIVEVTEEFQKRPYRLHMAVAPTKSIDRFEWFLEKATEIGVDTITPLLCENSERKIVKQDRIERVVVAAMKQSIKAYKPKVNPLQSFNDFFSQSNSEEVKLIAHCYESDKSTINNRYKAGENICILIGPEGDFTLNEVNEALKYGCKPISLGNSRLRTETAGVVACHTISLLNLISY